MILDYSFAFIQYITPQHCLSRLIGMLAHCHYKTVKTVLIRLYIWVYKIDLKEAVRQAPCDYENFNDFFTRHLQKNRRPIADNVHGIVSPVDGIVYQIGKIKEAHSLTAKGFKFELSALIGNDNRYAKRFKNGLFCSFYLAPSDYHRIHMPLSGRLTKMSYIPGKLFSVNPSTTRTIDHLFTRNERVICHFTTEEGPIIMVLIGAMIVGSIYTVWAGKITPSKQCQIQHWDYQGEQQIMLKKGDELGWFQLGSSVIILTATSHFDWQKDATAMTHVKMGQLLATFPASRRYVVRMVSSSGTSTTSCNIR